MSKDHFDTLVDELTNATEEYQRVKTKIAEICQEIVGQVTTIESCHSCLWFSGKTCQCAGPPYHLKAVNPTTGLCNYYQRTKYPRSELIKKVGEPKQREISKYQFGTCAVCGHKIPITKVGVLYQHETDGVQVRGPAAGWALCKGSKTKPGDTIDPKETTNPKLPTQ